MDQKDLKQIGQIFEEKVSKVEGRLAERMVNLENKVDKTITEVLEQNIMPAMNELYKKMDKMEGRMDKMEGTVANLPDKFYITDKLADLAAEIFNRLDRRLEKERDFKKKITEIIKRNKLGTAKEISYLEGLAN